MCPGQRLIDMKSLWKILAFLCIMFACSSQIYAQRASDTEKDLAMHLQAKDSLLFDIAFHSCAVERLPEILTSNFLFLQDRGLENATTSQTFSEFQSRMKNGCGLKGSASGRKMRREVLKSSIQTYLLNPSEAIQTGVQRFYMAQADGQETMVEESKFTRNWRKENRSWKMAAEMDYLLNTNPQQQRAQNFIPPTYSPASKSLYDTVVQLDSVYFDTYNSCKIAKMDSLTAENLEFYHDRGGLMTSKKDYIESIRKNICGKVTRKLARGSIEVYEIPGFGAVEEGFHSFRNLAEKSEGEPSKFIILWRKEGNRWQLTRVVSLH
jgi:hypothetical protein